MKAASYRVQCARWTFSWRQSPDTSTRMGQAQGLNNFGCCAPESGGPEPVTLNIYDLHGNGRSIFNGMNVLLRAAGTGVFHVGVEVFNREWSFGHKEGGGTGVYSSAPRESELHSYRESVVMGDTDLAEYEVERLIKRMCYRWTGDSYDILNRNCCHFCDELCMELHVERPSFVGLPEWLNSMLAAGATLRDPAPPDVSEDTKIPALDMDRGRSLTPPRRRSPDMDGKSPKKRPPDIDGKYSRKRPLSAENRAENTPSKDELSTERETNESRGLTISFSVKW